MGAVALVGWAAFGIAGVALAVLGLRLGGVKGDLKESETHRESLEQDLRDVVRAHQDREANLLQALADVRDDFEKARDEMEHLYRANPKLAVARIDAGIAHARDLLTRLRSGRPPGVPDSGDGT